LCAEKWVGPRVNFRPQLNERGRAQKGESVKMSGAELWFRGTWDNVSVWPWLQVG